MLGVDSQSQDTLLKYIGGLQIFLRHTILVFNPNNIDDVCVQATHLEARGKNTLEECSKNPFKSKGKEKAFKGKEKKMCLSKKEERKFHANIVPKRVTMKLLLEASSRNETKKINNKGKQKTTKTTQQDLGSDLGDETKITAMGIKGK